MAQLVLVNPLTLRDDPTERRLLTPYFPLGLLYLAAVVRRAGFEVAVFDGMFADEARFRETLLRERPPVVGITALATVRQAALRLAAIARAAGATVVMGGADPTARPEAYLRHRVAGHSVVDLVVVGEGEQTLLELLPKLLDDREAAARPNGVAGLAYLDESGMLVRTAPRPRLADLDALPPPARDLVDLEPYRRTWRESHGHFSLSIIASRGCPYACSWCQKSVFGQVFRPRSPRAVAEEMRHLKEAYRPDHVRIVDDVMGIDRAWVRDWRDAVLALDAAVPFECLSRVDLMDDELAGLLKEVGCQRVAFGAESGSQRVLDAMDKGTTVEQIRMAATTCRRHGLETYFYLMLGYPGESWPDIRMTAALLRETRPDSFSSTIAYPLPGTPFFAQVEDRLLAAPDWDYTAENRLLFQREYSTSFYRWVQRWLFQEWRAARLRHGEETASGRQRLRAWAARQVARAAVEAHRRVPVRGAGRSARRDAGEAAR